MKNFNILREKKLMTLTKGDPCDHLSLEGRNPRKCSLFKMFFGFMYKLYRHKLYRHNLYRHKLYRHKLYREQIVSGTNCIGNILYRAQIVSCNKLYRGTNCIGHKLYRGTNCIGAQIVSGKNCRDTDYKF
jgi:hypothetical protein